MFPTIVVATNRCLNRRSKKDAGPGWEVVVPARRTLTGKRITRKDIRRVTRKQRRRLGASSSSSSRSSNQANKKGEKNTTNAHDQKQSSTDQKQSRTEPCENSDRHRVKPPPGRRRAKVRKRVVLARVPRVPCAPKADNAMGGSESDKVGHVKKDKKHDRKHTHGEKRNHERRIKAVRPRSKNKNKSDISHAMTGKKSQRRKSEKDSSTTPVQKKGESNDLNIPQGPHEHTRVELETFTKQRLSELRQQQLEVGAMHCRIVELETEAAGMTARHLIHQRRELQKQIEEMRDKAHKIESGDEINDFCRDAARFFYTFDRLKHDEKNVAQGTTKDECALKRDEEDDVEEGTLDYLHLDEEGLAQSDVINFDGDGKNDEKVCQKRETVGEEKEEEEEDTDILRPEGTLITADEQITREQVPALVMPNHIQDMIRERQRQVTKPDLRVMTRGRGSSTVCADSFLAKFGSVHKPLCTLSDEQCSMCGTGQLVLDVIADVLVCENCRHEQTSSQSSDRNVGYNNAKSIHYSACRYRRITHFVAHLDRFCGCVGSSKLTPKLLSKVMQWMRTHNVKRVKVSNVEDALKDMGFNKLTNHKVVITARITGIKPPRFAPDERYQMIEMFLASEHAFAFLRRTGQLEGRLNYLNYTYTMYKFVEIMSWGHRFLKYFRLLRGKENLAKQDRYWRKVCKIVGLPFIRSV
jgi:hypothetical protein